MFDLDGTLVLGDRSGKSYDVLPGAIEVLSRLRERGIPYVVLTNGSGQVPALQAAKLRSFGLPIDDQQMLTPSSVTAGVFTARRREARAGAGPARRGPCAEGAGHRHHFHRRAGLRARRCACTSAGIRTAA